MTSRSPESLRGDQKNQARATAPHAHASPTAGLAVGSTIMVAQLGAAVVQEITLRVPGDPESMRLRLRTAKAQVTIEMPSKGGVEFSRHEGMDSVFNALTNPTQELSSNSSRRYKSYLDKLSSGDEIQLAEVVGDLWRRSRETSLSAGEVRLLQRAREALLATLSQAEEISEGESESLLELAMTIETARSSKPDVSVEEKRNAILAKLDALGPLPSGV